MWAIAKTEEVVAVVVAVVSDWFVVWVTMIRGAAKGGGRVDSNGQTTARLECVEACRMLGQLLLVLLPTPLEAFWALFIVVSLMFVLSFVP